MHSLLAALGLTVRRTVFALVSAGPGVGLLWLYGQRLQRFRAEPSLSPGTPEETWIALMVLVVASASFGLAALVLQGRIARPLGAGGFMSLAAVAAMMSLTFVRVQAA